MKYKSHITGFVAACCGVSNTAYSQTVTYSYAAWVVSPVAFFLGLFVGFVFRLGVSRAERAYKTTNSHFTVIGFGFAIGCVVWLISLLSVGEPARRLLEAPSLFLLFMLLLGMIVAWVVFGKPNLDE
jgi:uncharacterized membrane protein